MIILDVGPSSVRVEWSDSTLPSDNGGAPFRTVRLSYREANDDMWSSNPLEVDVERMYAVVSGLQDRTTYYIRMEVGNAIGMIV